MCGLVTIVSKKSFGFIAKDVQVFEQLLYADYLRGEDSTGVIGADKYGNFYIDKSAISAHDFLQQWSGGEHYKEMQKDGVALIGHNRKGTVGKISDVTAHPFVVKNQFAMVHNGTLYGHRQLHDTDVDSEALAMHIEETINSDDYSLDKLGQCLADVYGAYACIWYNQKTHKVQFVRNNQRPLCIADTQDAWYLASEATMLHWILSRNGIKATKLELIKEDVLHTLSPGEATAIVMEEIPEKKSTPVSPPTGCGTGSLGMDTEDKYYKNISTISKNKFKRFNKRMCGRRVEFWVGDYVEKHLFQENGSADVYKIMGESDQLTEIAHVIRGEISLKALGLNDIEYIDNYFLSGEITQVINDTKMKCLEVHVTDIRLVPVSPAQVDAQHEENPVTVH